MRLKEGIFDDGDDDVARPRTPRPLTGGVLYNHLKHLSHVLV